MARRSVSPRRESNAWRYGKTGQYTRRGGGDVEGQERSKRTSSWPIICTFLPKPSGIASIRVMHGPKVRACSSLNTRDRSGRIFSNVLFACNILQRDDHKSLIKEACPGRLHRPPQDSQRCPDCCGLPAWDPQTIVKSHVGSVGPGFLLMCERVGLVQLECVISSCIEKAIMRMTSSIAASTTILHL